MSYAIEGPAVISFSGGRSSGFMLRHILDHHAGQLPDDVHIVFADTGKERPATYDFVRECAERWEIEIHTVERPGGFEQLITDRSFLPHPRARFCTSELKVIPMRAWMLARGYAFWENVVGIRSDEPRRFHRLRANDGKDLWDYGFPLVAARVTARDVLAWWRRQPFDLQLAPHESNCDLCFLKRRSERVQIVADNPGIEDWWIAQEKRIGATFRKGQPVAGLLVEADARRRQLPLFEASQTDDGLGDCICGD